MGGDNELLAMSDADKMNRLLNENRELKAVRNREVRRERIATAAMQGVLTNGAAGLSSHSEVADVACLFADALIKKLEEEDPNA